MSSAAIVVPANVQVLLNRISTTQGVILFRGASAWEALGVGSSGHFLQTQGAAANPIWAAASGAGLGDVSGPASATDGGIAVFDGTSGKNIKQTTTPNIGEATGTTLLTSGILDTATYVYTGPRAAASGVGGSVRYRDDTGGEHWLTGILGGAAEERFFIYDLKRSRQLVTIDSPAIEGDGLITLNQHTRVNGQLHVGREKLGVGMGVFEGTLAANVDNQDGVVITTHTNATTNGTYAMFGFSSQCTHQTISAGVYDQGSRTGATGDAYSNSTDFAGRLAKQVGLRGRSGFADGAATAVVDLAIGVETEIRNDVVGPTITTAAGVYIRPPAGSGTITTLYDIYSENTNGRTYLGGSVGIGTASPSYKLDVTGRARINNGTEITLGTDATGALLVGGGASVTKDLQVGLGSGNSYTLYAGGNGGTHLVTLGGGTSAKIQAVSSGAFAATTLHLNPLGGGVVTGLISSAAALAANSSMTFELTSNTSLTVKVRGTDGTTRSIVHTLS